VGVAIAVAGLLGLVLLLLAVPLNVDFRVDGIQPFRGQVGVRWLFGLVRTRLPFPAASRPGPKEPVEPGGDPRRARSGRRSRPRNVLAALREAGLRGRVQRLASDLVRAVHFHRLRLLVRLGLGDPADTGRLWAVMGPVNAIAQSRGADVRIEPDFLEPVLEIQADGRVAIVPLRILLLAMGFVLSPPTIRAWRALRGDRA